VRTRSLIKPVAIAATGGALAVVAITGTRALTDLDLAARPLWVFPGAAFEIILLAAAVLCLPLVVVGMVLRRREQRDAERGEFEWLRRVVGLAVLVASVLVLGELLPTVDEGGPAADGGPAGTDTGPEAVIWSGWTALLAVALAAGALVVLWWRRRAAPPAPRQLVGGGEGQDGAAAQAGRIVLDRQWDDPRAAVVDCYAAMEAVLAAADSPRPSAETPEELLERTVASGRLAPGPGRQLTELFLAARYSSSVVTPADVDAARQTLRVIEGEAAP
jgi:Domain of unknown function (DUF4129)